MENNGFKTKFVQRAHALCDSLLLYDQIVPYSNSIINALRLEIESHRQRFGYPESIDTWNWGNTVINDFLKQRTDYYLDMIDNSPLFKATNHPTNTDDFVCYPNPSDNEAFIKMLDERSRPFEITICDAIGRIYYHENHYFAPCEILEIGSRLNPGLYFIKVGEKHKSFLKK